MTSLRILHSFLACASFFLLSGASRAASPVVMKVLVLAGASTEKSYQSITTVLDQVGVPRQSIVLNSIQPDASGNRLSQVALSDPATGRGLYQGIILTDSTFAACGSSCLSQADWTKLNTYASQFSVRVASYFTVPAAQWGLLPVDGGATYKAAQPLNATLTAAGAAVFSYLNAANSIPVAGSATNGIMAYLAAPTAGTNEVTTPLMMAGGNTVAVTHTTSDGREVMALTMDNDPALLHSSAFGYGVINWVTRGVFLGSRRVFLDPQLDDILLGNWIYAPGLHPSCENTNSCPTYFETGSDLQAMANWQANLQSDPLFQGYRTTFAYNGVGTTWFAPSDPIFAAIKALNSQFWWISHTWDHANLDCYTQSQNGNCVAATQAQSLSELNQNIAVAPQLGITLDKAGLVTPFNSGLSNINFLRAAVQAGIKYIVYPALPASPNTPIVNSLLPSIIEITRIKSNFFDDASSPLTGVYGSWPDEYNAQYGPNGSTPLYTQNQTYSRIVDIESQNFLQNYMLSYAPYLLAFHIANGATYDGVHSIYTDVMDATAAKYRKVFTLPVVSMTMEDIGALMSNRSTFNNSGVVGVYTPGVSIVLTTTNAATIPLTGACSQSSCGTYGGQVQDSVVMAANSTTTVALNQNIGVSLSGVSVNPSSVAGGTSSAGTVTLNGPAPAGGVSVSLGSDNLAVTVPTPVSVPAGATTATFSVSTVAVTASASATITASYNGASKTATLTVSPSASSALSSVALNPASVAGGATSSGTVSLTAAASSGGVVVSLTSSNASVTLPASVTVAAGSTTASFTVSTTGGTSGTSAIITASYNNVSKTATLTVTPATVSLVSISLAPSSVSSGTASTGTVTLSATAPSGGILVALSSSVASATVPASVLVAAGSTTVTFSVSTRSVAYTTSATITGTYNSVSKSATLTINPLGTVALSSVTVNPASVVSEQMATATVTLSAAAPAGGIVVSLWTTGTIAFVPDSVTIAAGSTTATFTVTTNYTTTTQNDTVTAFYNGASKTATVKVTP